MRREYYWPQIGNDGYMNVKDCPECAHNKTNGNARCPLQLFTPTGPLEFVAMHILGLLTKPLRGNKLVMVMKDWYSKFARPVPTFKMTALHIASLLMDNWVIPYEISSNFLTDNGTQFTNKFFEMLCAFLGTEHLINKAYHQENECITWTIQEDNKGKNTTLHGWTSRRMGHIRVAVDGRV